LYARKQELNTEEGNGKMQKNKQFRAMKKEIWKRKRIK
jgi:hypothetical protein